MYAHSDVLWGQIGKLQLEFGGGVAGAVQILLRLKNKWDTNGDNALEKWA